jgi:hypothetical protein
MKTTSIKKNIFDKLKGLVSCFISLNYKFIFYLERRPDTLPFVAKFIYRENA